MFRLFTDDLRYPTFLQTIQFLQSGGIDFFTLGDTIASAGFRFILHEPVRCCNLNPQHVRRLGGCLGKRKKIIHDKKWMDTLSQETTLFGLNWRKAAARTIPSGTFSEVKS